MIGFVPQPNVGRVSRPVQDTDGPGDPSYKMRAGKQQIGNQ